jgi:hypothetical protein
MLTRNKSLKVIALNSCKISDSYLLKNDYFSSSHALSRIEEIEMENNYIGNKGGEVLKEFVMANGNILKLGLRKNCIGERLLL